MQGLLLKGLIVGLLIYLTTDEGVKDNAKKGNDRDNGNGNGGLRKPADIGVDDEKNRLKIKEKAVRFKKKIEKARLEGIEEGKKSKTSKNSKKDKTDDPDNANND